MFLIVIGRRYSAAVSGIFTDTLDSDVHFSCHQMIVKKGVIQSAFVLPRVTGYHIHDGQVASGLVVLFRGLRLDGSSVVCVAVCDGFVVPQPCDTGKGISSGIAEKG